MMVVILRPTVADITDMDRLWAHGGHLLGRLSPGIDPGPDRVLFVLQRLRILVASAFDALVAVLEDHAIFLEKLDPSVVKLVALVPVFHFVQQFFERCFVDFADVVLPKTNPRLAPQTKRRSGRRKCFILARVWYEPSDSLLS